MSPRAKRLSAYVYKAYTKGKMAKDRIQGRVDDTRKREVEQYAEEHDVTQSEALRRLLGRGIDYEKGHLASSSTDDDGDGDGNDDGDDGDHTIESALPPLGRNLVGAGDYLLKMVALFTVGMAVWSVVAGVSATVGVVMIDAIITGLVTAGALYVIALVVALLSVGLSAPKDALRQVAAESELPRLVRGGVAS